LSLLAAESLYGGYGGPVYPTAKIEGSNLLEEMEENPEDLEYDIFADAEAL